MTKASHDLHSSYFHPVLRQWSANINHFCTETFVFPVFVSSDPNANEEISSLPLQRRVGQQHIVQYLADAVADGLKAVLLFACLANASEKDSYGSAAIDAEKNPLATVIPLLKQHYPQLLICCDVCLCGHTSHGHCGILRSGGGDDDAEDKELVGTIDATASRVQVAKSAAMLAKAGAHVVAPSDMMDGRIGEIKQLLQNATRHNSVAVMSYSCKFASGFYGPFRDAAKSAPGFGDRSCYQLPHRSVQLAMRAAQRDVKEGADILMVKPGTAYLDVVSKVRAECPNHPLAIYHVSGEWAMLYHAANAGACDLQTVTTEVFGCMLRAGANIIISYATPLMLRWMKEQQ